MPLAFISEFDVVSLHSWLEEILQRLLKVGMQISLMASVAISLCREVVFCICQN